MERVYLTPDQRKEFCKHCKFKRQSAHKIKKKQLYPEASNLKELEAENRHLQKNAEYLRCEIHSLGQELRDTKTSSALQLSKLTGRLTLWRMAAVGSIVVTVGVIVTASYLK